MQGLYPAAWIDLSKTWKGHQLKDLTCKDRVEIYLKGIVGMRPMIDLNSYFILVLNQDPTISVIDPIVGITGRTIPLLKGEGKSLVEYLVKERNVRIGRRGNGIILPT